MLNDEQVEFVNADGSHTVGPEREVMRAYLIEKNRTIKYLREKLAYYEEAIPLGKGHCYHRFTDEGVCIRCGEDAEEWDAGCVEEIVEDLQSVTTREFLTALQQITKDKSGGPIDVILPYMDKIDKFVKGWELIESWKERSGGVDVASGAVQPTSDGFDTDIFTL